MVLRLGAIACSLFLSTIASAQAVDLDAILMRDEPPSLQEMELVRAQAAGAAANAFAQSRDRYQTMKRQFDYLYQHSRALDWARDLIDAGVSREIYFIGNGMSFVYESLRLLFDDQADQMIKFLRVSRALLEPENYDRAKMRKYFAMLGWSKDQYSYQHPLFIYDSTGAPKGKQHSILRLKEEIVAYFVDQGATREAAERAVVPVFTPEGPGVEGYGSLQSYREDVEKPYVSGSARYFPGIKVSLGLTETRIIHLLPRWNSVSSKFSRFREDGLPILSEGSMKKVLTLGDPRTIEELKRTRLLFIYYQLALHDLWKPENIPAELKLKIDALKRRFKLGACGSELIP